MTEPNEHIEPDVPPEPHVSPETPLTPLSPLHSPLAANLAAYKHALEQEFNLVENPELADPDVLADKARKHLVNGLPKAIASIIDLSENSANENIRLNSSKYIIDLIIGKNAAVDTSDPMEKLLNRLLAESATTPTSTTDSDSK